MERTVKLDCGDHYIWTTIKNDDPQWEKFEKWRDDYSRHSNAHPWAAWQAASKVAEQDNQQKQARIEQLEAAVKELREALEFCAGTSYVTDANRVAEEALNETENLK